MYGWLSTRRTSKESPTLGPKMKAPLQALRLLLTAQDPWLPTHEQEESSLSFLE